MFFIRTQNLDPHVEVFFAGKRTFEIQVQGKFKRQPIGEIYVGGATTEKMELGMINRAICNTLTKFTSAMVPCFHFSFGDPETHPLCEFPHAVGPLFSTIDRMVVTPPGGKPPSLGTPLIEDQEFRKVRLKSRSIKEFGIDLNATYTFSQNTNNIDFAEWSIVGIPVFKQVDMRSIFGDVPARLISYEIPDARLAECGDKHPAKFVNYVFNVQITRLDVDAERLVDIAAPTIEDDEQENEYMLDSAGSPMQLARINSAEDDEDIEGDGDYPSSSSVPVRRGIVRMFSRNQKDGNEAQDRARTNSDVMESDSRDPLGVGRWIRKQMNPEAVEVDETADLVTMDVYMETDGDLRYCPACIEVNDHRREGRRRIVFLIPWANTREAEERRNMHPLANLEPRLRSFNDFSKKIPLVPLPKMFKNRKMSIYEKQRRVIVESYKELMPNGKPDPSLSTFLSKVNTDDLKFLSDVPVSHVGKGVFSKGTEKWEGSCCLAMDRRHFVEGFLVLTEIDMVLTRTRDSKRCILKLPLHALLRVKIMRPEETPFPGFKFFSVETFARVYYFMVRSERQLSAWIQGFSTVLPSDAMRTSDDELGYSRRGKRKPTELALYGNINNAYYAKTPTWRLEHRRILNFRSIIFNSEGLPERLKEYSPCELLESILKKAFKIAQDSESVSLWISFMNEVSMLQTIDIYDLSETEKTAFFLNLYHTMILHGMLIFGPPTSWASWPSFFNSVSYLLAFDVVSINELEHSILRYSLFHDNMISNITGGGLCPGPLRSSLNLPHRTPIFLVWR